MLEELLWSFMLMLSQKLQRTSEPFVLERKVLVNKVSRFISKDPLSIELSPNSWLKEEISLPEMELAVSQSMAISSLMRTSRLDTPREVIFPWPMPDQTQTDHNSSFASFHAIG